MSNLIPRMKYAFFGMSLEAGTKTVAYLNIVTYAVLAVTIVINFLMKPIRSFHEDDMMDLMAFDDHAISEAESWKLGEKLRATFFVESSVVMQIVFAMILLYGANTKDPKYLLSWVILESGLIFHSQLTVLLNFIAIQTMEQLYTYNIVPFVLQEITTIGFQCYCMLIVYHYHEQLVNVEDSSERTART